MSVRHLLASALFVAATASCAQILDIPDRRTAPHFTCAGGVCGCEPGFGDCDAEGKNGCESDLSSSQANCGACGQSCDNGSCEAGACTCSEGFADCDGDASNGCEVDLRSSSASCGACGHDCLGGTCTSGSCDPLLIGAESGDFGVVGGLVRAGDTVYFADIEFPSGGGQHSRIMKMPLGGGALEVVADLADRLVAFFAGDDQGLALLTDQGLVTYDFATSNLATVDPQTFDYDTQLTIAGADLFYTVPPMATLDLYRLPRAGGTSPTFLSSDVQELAADFELRSWGGRPYWLGKDSGVDTIDGSGNVVPLPEAAGKMVSGLIGDGTHFYLAYSTIIERHDIQTGAVDTIDSPASLGSLTKAGIAGPELVWQEGADLVLWDGADKRTLVPALPLAGGGVSILLPDSVLYFESEGIYRIAR